MELSISKDGNAGYWHCRMLRQATCFSMPAVLERLKSGREYRSVDLHCFYRKAVPSHSPGLPPSATLGNRIRETIQPQRGCVSWRNPFRVENGRRLFPGLKQPWASRRNRFAV
jgi:hypothetical protein